MGSTANDVRSGGKNTNNDAYKPAMENLLKQVNPTNSDINQSANIGPEEMDEGDCYEHGQD